MHEHSVDAIDSPENRLTAVVSASLGFCEIGEIGFLIMKKMI